MRKNKSLCFLILTLSILPSFFTASETAQATAYTTSPVVMDIGFVNPGTTIQDEVHFHNEGDPRDVRLSQQDFYFDRQTDKIYLDQGSIPENQSLSSWTTVESEVNFTAQTGWNSFPVEIKIPRDAPAGAYYAAVQFNLDLGETTRDSAVRMQQRNEVVLALNIRGETEEMLQILNFDTNRYLYHRLPVVFETTLQNEGNVYLNPTGIIRVKNMFGQTATEREFNPDALRRSYHQTNDVFETIWDDSHLHLGRYTAELEITYGESQTILTAETSFWVLPWWLIVMLILLLLLSTFFPIYSYHRYLLKKRPIDQTPPATPQKPQLEETDQKLPSS